MKATIMLSTNQERLRAAIPSDHQSDPTSTIRYLNDTFREQLTGLSFLLGHVVKTEEVRTLPWGLQWEILNEIKSYDDFESDDPETFIVCRTSSQLKPPHGKKNSAFGQTPPTRCAVRNEQVNSTVTRAPINLFAEP